MNKFRKDYGVFCCEHVFNKQREIKLIVRDDGYQFLCGDDDINESEPRFVGIVHILEYQPEIGEVALKLPNMYLAFKNEETNAWEVEELG